MEILNELPKYTGPVFIVPSEKIDIAAMKKLEQEDMIRIREDDTFYIFNYTPACQAAKLRDSNTMIARGLITDKEGNVVARGFDKFFNYEELESLPKGFVFELQEKIDGSLITVFFYEGERRVASRGSLTSKWAEEGKKMLDSIEGLELDKEYTHLFEIVFPENKIVIDYGDERKLYYLRSRHTKTGEYKLFEEMDRWFTMARMLFGDKSADYFSLLQSTDIKNQEGFVAYLNGRPYCKIKFETYVRLHWLMTEMSVYNIWEMLKDDMPINDMLQDVPDEFYRRATQTIFDFKVGYNAAKTVCEDDYNSVKDMATRKEQAEFLLKECPYPGVVFAMLDGKKYEEMIWKTIKPESKDKFLDF